MFQSPSSAPSSKPPSDTSSPSMRNVGLPTQQLQQPHQGQSSHTPPNPSQLAHSFTHFVPSNNGPNGGPPRSPQYPRQMSNCNGPRSQGGQNGAPPAGLSSPRLASHPHNSQSSMPPPPPPQMSPQMQPMWGYYVSWILFIYFLRISCSFFQISNTLRISPILCLIIHNGGIIRCRSLLNTSHHHTNLIPAHKCLIQQGCLCLLEIHLPLFRIPQRPLSHTIASPVHPSPLPSALSHSSNSLGLTSPPPTLSTPSISGSNRLDVGSRTFVPRAAAKLTIKKADGTEVSLENLTKSTPTPPASAVPSSPNVVLRQGSPGTPNRRPTSKHMETEDQRKSRLAEQEQNDKLKAEAADKEKKEKEKAKAEHKAKVAEEAPTTNVRGVSRAQVKKNSFRFLKKLITLFRFRSCLKKWVGLRKAATTKLGPQDTRHVIWANSKWFFSLSCFIKANYYILVLVMF